MRCTERRRSELSTLKLCLALSVLALTLLWSDSRRPFGQAASGASPEGRLAGSMASAPMASSTPEKPGPATAFAVSPEGLPGQGIAKKEVSKFATLQPDPPCVLLEFSGVQPQEFPITIVIAEAPSRSPDSQSGWTVHRIAEVTTPLPRRIPFAPAFAAGSVNIVILSPGAIASTGTIDYAYGQTTSVDIGLSGFASELAIDWDALDLPPEDSTPRFAESTSDQDSELLLYLSPDSNSEQVPDDISPTVDAGYPSYIIDQADRYASILARVPYHAQTRSGFRAPPRAPIAAQPRDRSAQLRAWIGCGQSSPTAAAALARLLDAVQPARR